MSSTFRITLLIALCSAASACQPGGDDTAAARPGAAGAESRPQAAAGAPSSGAFTCDDGSSVELAWGSDNVVVTWPDGRTETLPRAESASGPDGDAYVGDTVSIEHADNRIVLREGGKPALACTGEGGPGAAAGTAAAAITMRYACEPDTRVTVFSDDTARVALPDGQNVTMRRIAGSEPPTFTGGSLYFTVGEADARLSQGDQANELFCTAT